MALNNLEWLICHKTKPNWIFEIVIRFWYRIIISLTNDTKLIEIRQLKEKLRAIRFSLLLNPNFLSLLPPAVLAGCLV